MRTLFVLGAGASVEAGLPTSAGLLTKVLEYADSCSGSLIPVGGAVRWAHRQMFRQITNPWMANVELLYNILQSAGSQPGLPESAVFTGMKRAARGHNRRYLQTLQSPLPWPHTRTTKENVFLEAMQGIEDHLLWWLSVREDNEAKSHYMIPLVNYCVETGSAIATLNYDNVIELAAQAANVAISDGVANWTQLRGLSFDEDAVPLLKLHGSFNWIARDERLDGGHHRRETIHREDRFDLTPRRNRKIIFGGVNKMTFEAPFPDLYGEFRRRASEAEAICVIGYSGADPHVNVVLKEWGFTAQETFRFSEATRGGKVYERLFSLPDHRLKFYRHEWPRNGTTGPYVEALPRLLDETMSRY